MKFKIPSISKHIKSFKDYVIKNKLYFTVPLTGLTISNYVKDVKLNYLEDEIEQKRTLVSDIVVGVSMSNYNIHDVATPMGFKMYDRTTKKITGVKKFNRGFMGRA